MHIGKKHVYLQTDFGQDSCSHGQCERPAVRFRHCSDFIHSLISDGTLALISLLMSDIKIVYVSRMLRVQSRSHGIYDLVHEGMALMGCLIESTIGWRSCDGCLIESIMYCRRGHNRDHPLLPLRGPFLPYSNAADNRASRAGQTHTHTHTHTHAHPD
jgi:hypothetical protein